MVSIRIREHGGAEKRREISLRRGQVERCARFTCVREERRLCGFFGLPGWSTGRGALEVDVRRAWQAAAHQRTACCTGHRRTNQAQSFYHPWRERDWKREEAGRCC